MVHFLRWSDEVAEDDCAVAGHVGFSGGAVGQRCTSCVLPRDLTPNHLALNSAIACSRLACDRCGRAGQYRKQNLGAVFGRVYFRSGVMR